MKEWKGRTRTVTHKTQEGKVIEMAQTVTHGMLSIRIEGKKNLELRTNSRVTRELNPPLGKNKENKQKKSKRVKIRK